MRKRLVLGNAAATLVVIALGFVFARLGFGHVASTIVLGTLVVALTSANAIAVVNELLRNLSRVEEAVLRVTFGESGVRIGAVEPPYDGLAHRLDQTFERLDAVAGDAGPEGA